MYSCAWVFFTVRSSLFLIFFFFFNDTATTEIYTLSLHDALPISFIFLSLTTGQATNRLPRHSATTHRAKRALVRYGCGEFRAEPPSWSNRFSWPARELSAPGTHA